MERNKIYKWMNIFGMIFLTLSAIEVIDFIFFNIVINLDIGIYSFTVSNLVFASGFMTPHASLIWILFLLIIICFGGLGFFLIRTARKEQLENSVLAKFWLLIGLFLITGGFIKMEFIVLLARSQVDTGYLSINFQELILNSVFTPFFGVIMWFYFIIVVCCFLLSGLVFGGIGLKWILDLQEENPVKKNKNN